MANKDFDCTALLTFIESGVGKSLNDIADHFGVSTRTVQRRLRELRQKYTGLDIRESTDGGVKTYRCIRHGITVSMGLRKHDIMILHRLGMAAAVFRASGLIDHAHALEGHVEALMQNMPRAVRQSCQKELQRLSRLEHFTVGKNRPVAKKGVTEALQLACVAQRQVSILLSNGKDIRGGVEGISYDLRGSTKASFRLQDGTCRAITLNEIVHVNGIADLIAEDLVGSGTN